MSIAILATGDEIIHGDTLNTNGHAIAHILNSEGLTLGNHLACSDKEQDIVDCLTFLSQKHAIIIITGGLGPTSDDRTRFALSRFLNRPLVEFQQSLAHIQTRLMRANLTLNNGNRQQALFPADAIVLPNPNGTAMGCYLAVDDKLFILLPGPPSECLPMFTENMVPILQKTQHSDKKLLKWRLFGVAEGTIAEILDNALATIQCETGYRLETPYLEFKVRCDASLTEDITQRVEPLIAAHVIAPPEQKASQRLCLYLEKLQNPVVIIDEVTGGILQTLLQRPSNYQWLKFNDSAEEGRAQENGFHFHIKGLDEFWRQQPGQGATQVVIHYQHLIEQGTESHRIPYYSPNVVHYAAEWLCFRLFHLINQLHQRIA